MKILTKDSAPAEKAALAYLKSVRWLYAKGWLSGKSLAFILKYSRPTMFVPKEKEYVFSHGDGKFAGSLQNPRILRTYFFGLPNVVYPQAVRDLVPSDGLVFDVGASLGFHSMIYAKELVPNGQVWSFEPGARSYGVLIRNIELNALINVTTSQYGLSDSNHELRLGIPSKSQHHHVEKKFLNHFSRLRH